MAHENEIQAATEVAFSNDNVATPSAPAEQKPRGRATGFALMNAERRKAIASAGGKAAHARGTAHRFDSQAASEAGRKGGRAARKRAQQAAAAAAAAVQTSSAPVPSSDGG